MKNIISVLFQIIHKFILSYYNLHWKYSKHFIYYIKFILTKIDPANTKSITVAKATEVWYYIILQPVIQNSKTVSVLFEIFLYTDT
jgi:hypothetical protein